MNDWRSTFGGVNDHEADRESEVRRLRRQLSAMAEAHRRLLDAVTADLAEDR